MSAPDSTAFRKRFRAGIRRRNRREGASCVLVAVIGAGGWLSAPASQLGLGFGALAVGAVLVLVALLTIGPSGGRDVGEPLVDLRRDLRHQVRLLRWTPVWYLGPLVPGTALILAAGTDGSAAGHAMAALVAAAFVAVAVLNQVGAARLRRIVRGLDQALAADQAGTTTV